MIQQAWYKDWFNSPYYHLLYKQRDETEAKIFIEKLVTHLKPTSEAIMLDVACGKGRHSKVLAEMGFDVTGIDLSEASIAEAKQSETDCLHFYQHDMRLPFRINYYDVAFNLFTSFGYFKTLREHHNAIRTIAQSIKSGGSFVIDYLNVAHAQSLLIPQQLVTAGGIQFQITKWQDELHFYKQIQVVDQKRFAHKHLYTERVAKFGLGDFTEMLAYHHLQVQEVFGNYDLASYDIKKSPRLIIEARKRD